MSPDARMHCMTQRSYLVAVGGFRLHSPLLAPAFFVFAAPAFTQARRAPGCIMADVKTALGRQFSLSVWDSPRAMREYKDSGAHRRALRAARWLGDGPFARFTTRELPDWDTALAVWQEQTQQPLSPAPGPR